jgi:hypothetical protein
VVQETIGVRKKFTECRRWTEELVSVFGASFLHLKLKVGCAAFGRPKSIDVYINLSVAFHFSLLFEFDQQ